MLILNGVAYVAYGGNDGDCGAYHGWVVGVPLGGTGAQAWATTVDGAGIWGAGGPSSDGESIFVTTGNGKHERLPRHLGRERGALPARTRPRLQRRHDRLLRAVRLGHAHAEDLDLSGAGPW